ncbi:hypothetical protein SAMN05444008_105109 [Cnuella takakiae]|uniref:Uncharacterized protein n=1 Tax=Cnuella takakiae TaxID=1302690 RepID=A0A1M4Z7H4_9BACT|nr:hypothetical protein [Cnuella takakiae]OLY94312.1 hypothetical protein BUE76_22300 [Cnuella takakiae]SHF13702.1 hypothetical protein SAMN05444008_105109 [Cnuella takakiae]
MFEIKLSFPSAGSMLRFIVAEEVIQVALSDSEHAIYGHFSQQQLVSACAFFGASAMYASSSLDASFQFSR